MKVAERDELLIRLDGRTRNIEILTEKQEKHLDKLNGKVTDNMVHIDRNHNRIATLENLASNGFVLKVNKKQIAGGTGIVSTVVIVAIAICKGLGWL